MFGFVTASVKELDKAQQDRYGGVYCGICHGIKDCATQTARLGLRYDMAFLALLLMSLYEPQEIHTPLHCAAHPLRRRNRIDNEFVRYAADMNVALAYYKALDDYADEGKRKWLADLLGKSMDAVRQAYPRQCGAIESCIRRLTELEGENCDNPDETANCFGARMAELLVYREDLWAPALRQTGMALGRFIYLADAAVDYRRDKRKGKYNPYLAMETGEDPERWEEYLVLSMARCTAEFEKLPLVQDKPILDNILYSGVWCNFRRKKQEGRDGNE